MLWNLVSPRLIRQRIYDCALVTGDACSGDVGAFAHGSWLGRTGSCVGAGSATGSRGIMLQQRYGTK